MNFTSKDEVGDLSKTLNTLASESTAILSERLQTTSVSINE